MKRRELGFAAMGILLFTVATLTPQRSWACGGTFRPNCGQTAWLAKFISSSIVLPGVPRFEVRRLDKGDLILGCAGTAILVDDVPAISHQCEISDTVQTADSIDTFWSFTVFDEDPHLATHFAGNLDPAIDGPGTRTTGPVLAAQFNVVGFPADAADILRLETPPR